MFTGDQKTAGKSSVALLLIFLDGLIDLLIKKLGEISSVTNTQNTQCDNCTV